MTKSRLRLTSLKECGPSGDPNLLVSTAFLRDCLSSGVTEIWQGWKVTPMINVTDLSFYGPDPEVKSSGS